MESAAEMKNRNAGKKRTHMQKFYIIEQGVISFFLCCFSDCIEDIVFSPGPPNTKTWKNKENLGKDEN